jgi:hypothetical protein
MIRATKRSLQHRVCGINRRARKKGELGRISVGDLEHILARVVDACPQCRTPFTSRFRERWTYCFAVSLSLGGHNLIENGMIICRACEMARANAFGVRLKRAHSRTAPSQQGQEWSSVIGDNQAEASCR